MTTPNPNSSNTLQQNPTNSNKDDDKSLIKTVISRQHFEDLLKEFKDKYIIVEFYAVWCGACKMLTLQFQNLAEKYQDKLEVLKIDVDDLEELAIEYEVNQMPSYMIMKNGQKLEQYFGSKPEQLEAMVEKYLAK